MKYLEQLKKLDPASARAFIKQSIEDESFIRESVENKEISVPLLLSSKFLPESIGEALVKNKADAEFLVDQLISASYIPSLSLIEKIVVFGEEADGIIKKVINSFPSMAVPVSFIMMLINNGLIQSAIDIVKFKKEAQKEELIFLLLKIGINDKDIISLGVKNDEIVSRIVSDLNEGPSIYSIELINELIINGSNLEELEFKKVKDLPLSAKAYSSLFINDKKKKENEYGKFYPYRNPDKEQIEWNQELENLESNKCSEYLITNAPPGSKFRKKWIKARPNEASDEEIVDLINSEDCPSIVIKELVYRSIGVIKQVDLDRLELFVSPTELANYVGSNEEKALYLLQNGPSKFRSALRKKISLNSIPEEENKRKKSYFFEAFQSLKSEDLDEFRNSLNKGYDLMKFVADTRQSSKERSCEMLTLSGVSVLPNLTKEEFLAMLDTPIRYDYESGFPLPYKLTVKEALDSMKKISVDDAFSNCDNKELFILNKSLSDSDLSYLFSKKKDEIIEDKRLLAAYLKIAKSSPISVTDSELKELAKIMTKDELKKVVVLEEYSLDSSVSVKCMDGNFFLSDKEVLGLIKKRNILESDDFICELMNRDVELAKKVMEAYLGGNNELSKLAGEKVNIRRSAIPIFENALHEINYGTEKIVDSIFEDGGVLSRFKSELLDWEDALSKYGKGRAVVVPLLSNSDLYEIERKRDIKFKVNNLVFGYSHYDEEWIEGDFNIDHIHIDQISVDLGRNRSYSFVLSVMNKKNISSVNINLDHGDNISSKINLLINGLNFVGSNEFVNALVQGGIGSTSEFNVSHFKFLESRGLIVDDDLISTIIETNNDDNEVISWLSNRVGGLKGYILSQESVKYNSDESLESLKNAGIEIIPDNEIKMMDIEESLSSQGKNFEPIDLSSLSVKDKIKVVKFIESKIDPDFLKLNLATSNLDKLEMIFSYQAMKSVYSLDDDDLKNLLSLPDKVTKSKKIMKSIKDIVSLSGGMFAYRINATKNLVSLFNSKIELGFEDFIEITGDGEAVENQGFKVLTSSALNKIESFSELIKSNRLILNNKPKSEVMRFLRSASLEEGEYIEDTFQMIEAVLRGTRSLEDRKDALESEAGNEEAINLLNETISGVLNRLEEVAAMDDITHMHDRLVKLLDFIQSDPAETLGQDKYKKMENSKEVESSLGYSLYFPKTRGDLQYLGDENGWCVNYHKKYGDDVIKKGNILVGICEKGKESIKENVIALAHFLNNDNGKYKLEQLKWSSKKTNGNKNVDGYRDFNHNEILGLIVSHLKEYNKNKG